MSDFDFDVVAQALGVSRATLPAAGGEEAVGTPTASAPLPLVQPLSDEEWIILEAVLPRLPVKKPAADYRDRDFVNSALWFEVARHKSIGWGKLPQHFGPQSSREHRWARWCMLGYWTQVAEAVRDDERLPLSRRLSLCRLAADAEVRRTRILKARERLTGAR